MTTKTAITKTTEIATTTAKDLSQYYTADSVAVDIIAETLTRYAERPFDTIIEPSAGAGAFSRHLGADCIALDIDPKVPGIEKADFLQWTPTAPTGRCLVIGNPPFGKKAALGFLGHAAGFADVIAFILPRIFCKKSQQNRVHKNLHLVHEEEIPADAFNHEGKTVHVPCVLQIWERRPGVERLKHKLKTRHPHFERCGQAEADLVIRRIGAHAGVLKPLAKNWSAESNIFLRATGCSQDELKDRFARLDMAAHACNGAGGGSINMSEIVELYEEELAREAAAAATEIGLAMLERPDPDSPAPIAPAAEDAPAALQAAAEETAAPALDGLVEETRAMAMVCDRNAQPEGRHVVIEAATGAKAADRALERFNAAADGADCITVTGPLSFRKASVQHRLDPSFHLVEDLDATMQVVGSDGRSRERPCAVQTWERRAEPLARLALETRHPDFEFCDRAKADVAIQRVGTNAGRLKTPEEAGSAQSHLFLRAVICSPAELWARLAMIDFDTVRHNTAAVPSVAKTELVALYQAIRGIAAAATVTGKRPQALAAGNGRAMPRRESEADDAAATGAEATRANQP
ncbi:MAG: hypothetical protein ACU0A8_07550 [Limimaricola soesokkakensis]|uniref:hypothetical protein n=1 Tax=Limimaricola soesokkakensis TaxID=1343159 RepID=UPI004059E9D0